MKNAPDPTSPAARLAAAFRNDPKTSEIEALAQLRFLKEQIEEQEQQLVFELRHQGASWQVIATATGMASRQAAQKRYETGAGALDRLDNLMGRRRLPI